VSLIHDLKIERERLSGPSCLTCRWLEKQESEARLEVDAWIREDLSIKKLFRLLRDHGLSCGESSLRKHVYECVLKDRDQICR
jgi:hypothetical protein